MPTILRLFQIKTIRSAWVFLVGSGLLFIFGMYQIAITLFFRPNQFIYSFEITALSFWLLVTGAYMAIASWALFSQKGRTYLETEEQIPIKGNRGVLWGLKFMFACYAAAFATMMLLGILVLPFAGYAGLEAMFSPSSGLYLFIAGLLWSPLIFRYLK